MKHKNDGNAGIKKSAAESEDDKTETPSLNPKSMERLATGFSKAIQTEINAGVAAATAATTAAIIAQ